MFFSFSFSFSFSSRLQDCFFPQLSQQIARNSLRVPVILLGGNAMRYSFSKSPKIKKKKKLELGGIFPLISHSKGLYIRLKAQNNGSKTKK